eukprot:CAMPEP_0116955014 /NCGR_PEP_ID=MMETSP0467-20121206/42339_1 /TAXON_ID=283647 /ORGANISM="Mesodinium pulex, Strain SPMC105" /LENGTH=45 /DNA_ID= /DNA_START= /DNA_END= /DNA_ORIENTATION=
MGCSKSKTAAAAPAAAAAAPAEAPGTLLDASASTDQTKAAEAPAA